MDKTSAQYDAIIEKSIDIFQKKMKDYGTAWRILRASSITDQIYIKAKRIQSIEECGVQKVEDNIDSEYIGIINYSVMALIQLELGYSESVETNQNLVIERYKKYISTAKSLMQNKNHDYGEAWRNMRISSMTDIILMKLLRIKEIEDNKGKTIISEGLEANYLDIINWAVFALIKTDEINIFKQTQQ